MMNQKLKSRPPGPKTQTEMEKVRKDFISGKSPAASDTSYPWENPFVREDVKKLFSLRLSEPDMLKLQYINEMTGKSMHKFCLEVLLPAIEEEIQRLTH